MPWHDSWDQQSMANSFNTMTLQTPPSLMKWVTDSDASNHITPYLGNIYLLRPPYPAILSSTVVGNESVLLVTSIGITFLPKSFYLNNVLVTPYIIKNFLSIH
jgi:hypothetical protein